MTWFLLPVLSLFLAGLAEVFVAILPPTELATPCPRCNAALPRLNFGYCRVCAHWFTPRFFAIILVMSASVGYLNKTQTSTSMFFLGLAIMVYLTIVAFIDIEHHLIQHKVALFGIAFAILVGSQYHSLASTIVGGGFAILFMGFFYILGRWYAKFKNRGRDPNDPNLIDEALGFGDVSLSAVLGLLVGHAAIFQGLVTGILVAGAYSLFIVVFMAVKKDFDPEKTIPYGPFLILGAIIYLYPF